MTSNPKARAINALRHLAHRAEKNAVANYTVAADPRVPDDIRRFAAAEGIAWTQFQKILLGDIGEETHEVEAEPVELPTTAPAEAPAAPVPA